MQLKTHRQDGGSSMRNLRLFSLQKHGEISAQREQYPNSSNVPLHVYFLSFSVYRKTFNKLHDKV